MTTNKKKTTTTPKMKNIGILSKTEWTEEQYDDLSACWLSLEWSVFNFSIEYTGTYGAYKLWMEYDNPDDLPVLVSNELPTVQAAKETAQAIMEQWVMDDKNFPKGVAL